MNVKDPVDSFNNISILEFSRILILAFLFLHCTNDFEEKDYTHTLVPSDDLLVLETDSTTSIFPLDLQVIYDSTLAIVDRSFNGARFFNAYSGDSITAIQFDRVGPNSIGGDFDGFVPISRDSFIGKVKELEEIFFFNKSGKVSERFPVKEADPEDELKPTGYAVTLRKNMHLYNDLIFLVKLEMDKKGDFSFDIAGRPSLAVVDLNTFTANEILYHPEESGGKLFGSTYTFIDGYKDRVFISYPVLHDLRIYDIVQKKENTIAARSQNVAKDFGRMVNDDWIGYMMRYGFYWDVEYDPWREVIYRFAIHKVGDEDPQLYQTIADFPFSVIILDQEYNKIGEAEFPPHKYYLHYNFVGPKGLYIYHRDDDEFTSSYAILELKELPQEQEL